MSDELYEVHQGQVVAGNLNYVVAVGGLYGLNDLVPCRRVIDTNGPICAFLASSVLGYLPDIPEVNE